MRSQFGSAFFKSVPAACAFCYGLKTASNAQSDVFHSGMLRHTRALASDGYLQARGWESFMFDATNCDLSDHLVRAPQWRCN